MTRTRISRILTITAFALACLATTAGAQTDDLNKLLQQSGDAYNAGRYRESAEKGRQALTMAEKILAPDHIDIATILNNIGMAHLKLNDPKSAEPLFKRALGILEKKLPADDPKILITLENSLDIYWQQKRYKELEGSLKRLITAYRKQKNARLVDVLMNLSAMYSQASRPAEAIPYMLEALPLLESGGETRREQLASALHNLGAIYDTRGDADSSILFYERALTARGISDSLSTDYAATLNNLGRAYAMKGAYDKAEPLMNRAIAIVVKARGPNDPTAKAMMQNLASVLDLLNRHEEAVAMRKRAEGAAK